MSLLKHLWGGQGEHWVAWNDNTPKPSLPPTVYMCETHRIPHEMDSLTPKLTMDTIHTIMNTCDGSNTPSYPPRGTGQHPLTL